MQQPFMSGPREAEPTCEDLASRVIHKDRTAYAMLVQRHLGRTISIAQRIVLRRAEAEDIAQDVFLKFWQQPELFHPEKAKFTTWLYRVTLNRALDVVRKVRTTALDPGFDAPDPALSAHQQLEQAQKLQALATALAALPERQRAALVLSYQTEMTDIEAAGSLGITVGAYESLLVRGRKALREALRHDAE
jgi:RNA polymerase sigma-70 factor (ECF subfamily)